MTTYPFNYVYADRKTIVDDQIGFGVFDKRGREIGAEWMITAFEMLPVDPKASSFIMLPHGGTWYVVYKSATRGGKTYGASSQRMNFPTLAEAEDYLAKYLIDARKRAVAGK